MKKNKDEIIIYLKKVAYYLGDLWKVDARIEHQIYLINDDLKLHINHTSYKQNEKEKLFISGILPPAYGSYSKIQKIGVSYNRHAKSVARDIQKRYLDFFIPELANVKKSVLEVQKKADHLNNVTNLIKSVGYDYFDETVHSNKLYRRVFHAQIDNKRIDLTLSQRYESCVKVNGLSDDQMIKMMYFLKTL